MNNRTEIKHWGVKGMRWGVRRYQNKDGTLTAAGKKRRSSGTGQLTNNERRTRNTNRLSKLSGKSNKTVSSDDLNAFNELAWDVSHDLDRDPKYRSTKKISSSNKDDIAKAKEWIEKRASTELHKDFVQKYRKDGDEFAKALIDLLNDEGY